MAIFSSQELFKSVGFNMIKLFGPSIAKLESPQAALQSPYLRSSGWTTYLFTISYLGWATHWSVWQFVSPWHKSDCESQSVIIIVWFWHVTVSRCRVTCDSWNLYLRGLTVAEKCKRVKNCANRLIPGLEWTHLNKLLSKFFSNFVLTLSTG